MQHMKTQRPCCTVIVLGANFSLMLVSHFLLHIEYTRPNIVSFRKRWDSVFFWKLTITEASQKHLIWLLCNKFVRKAKRLEPLHKSVTPKQTYLVLFSPLFWPAMGCVSVCVCVPACLCVRGTGCLFCLPLSIALSCPLLSQQRKEPRPCGLSLVYVCGVSFSWDFRIHPCYLLTQNLLIYKIFSCTSVNLCALKRPYLGTSSIC